MPPVRHIPPLGAPKLKPRERVLAEWRGLDSSGWDKEFAKPAQTMPALVKAVLGRMNIDRRRAEAEILRVWNHLIDPTLAAHAQPSGIHKGTLFVTVDSSPWLDEIVRYRRKEILERLQHSFGRDLIVRISFRVG